MQYTCSSSWSGVEQIINKALSSLGKDDRNTIWLRYYKGLSISEIGFELGVSNDEVTKCMARALDKMHSKLSGYGITVPTTALSCINYGTCCDKRPYRSWQLHNKVECRHCQLRIRTSYCKHQVDKRLLLSDIL